MKDKLIDQVIEQIQTDIEYGDVTSLHELLRQVRLDNLEAYLSEDF